MAVHLLVCRSRPITVTRSAPGPQHTSAHVLAPYPRGFGPTRFRGGATVRSGPQPALAQDLFDFVDALDIGSAVLAGYDWAAGPRASLPRCVPSAFGAWSRSTATTSRTSPTPTNPPPRSGSAAGHNVPQETPEALADAVTGLLTL